MYQFKPARERKLNDKGRVRWVASNQVISAVLAGLDVHEGDYIGAVVGTGDLVFAMIAAGAHVESADSDPEQVKYFLMRIKQIQQNKKNDFLYSGMDENIHSTVKDMEARAVYFGNPNIWNPLVKNIRNLEVPQLSDIGTFLNGKLLDSSNLFDKLNLSNAPGWGWVGETEYGKLEGYFDCIRIFKAASNCLRPEGLVYRARFPSQAFFGKKYDGFVLDEPLTKSASKIETDWIPEVYRKV